MGIRFTDSILILLAATSGVLSAYFVGHALVGHDAGWAWITAAVLLLVGAGLGAFSIRRLRDYAAARGESPRMP